MIVILWMIDSEERRLNFSHHIELIEARKTRRMAEYSSAIAEDGKLKDFLPGFSIL